MKFLRLAPKKDFPILILQSCLILLLAIPLADLQWPSLGIKICDLLQSKRMNPENVTVQLCAII